RVCSIESGLLSRFFAKDADFPAELMRYFAEFDLIVSYLYDPDQIFETNLRRSGAQEVVCGPAKIGFSHAARQLAQPVEQPGLSALLERTIFVGHDSGICHWAAATGAKCILLFGPTDPSVWAPLNESARVIRAPDRDLCRLDVDLVHAALEQELMRIGIST